MRYSARHAGDVKLDPGKDDSFGDCAHPGPGRAGPTPWRCRRAWSYPRPGWPSRACRHLPHGEHPAKPQVKRSQERGFPNKAVAFFR